MDALEEINARLGETPRHFSWWARFTYLNFTLPGWGHNDPLRHCATAAPELLRNGDVVWGHTVQANQTLFEPGRHNAPGDVIYCPDPEQMASPNDLRDVAIALGRLKGTQSVKPELQEIAHHLTDEYVRHFGVTVPASLSDGCPCLFSSIFFVREHLPDRKLSLPFYPLLISEEYPGMTMVVPSRFWPEDFINHWIESGKT